MESIKVMHVDDCKLLLDKTKEFFQQVEGIEIIGCAQDGESAIHLAQKLNPDVILLDISLPDVNGINLIAPIHTVLPAARIIMLTMRDEPTYIHAAQSAGADGYVLKCHLCSKLVDEIYRVVSRSL